MREGWERRGAGEEARDGRKERGEREERGGGR